MLCIRINKKRYESQTIGSELQGENQRATEQDIKKIFGWFRQASALLFDSVKEEAVPLERISKLIWIQKGLPLGEKESLGKDRWPSTRVEFRKPAILTASTLISNTTLENEESSPSALILADN